MASDSPSTSTVDSKEKMDATVQAFNMLAQGKRNLICGEVPTAVTQFQEACKLLAEHYGEMASECAEAYYCYGSALLDLARMENGVLGNALEGVDIDADATESDTNKEEPEDNLTDAENKEVADDGKLQKEEEDEKETNASGCEEKDEEEHDEEEEEEEDQNPEGEDPDGDNAQKEDPDDVPNLQLAWEMLDLAKVIYLKDSSREHKLKAAQAYLKLGEVSMETEGYEQAVDDLKACLKLQQDNLEPGDRAIAETHYQLGLASQLNKQYDAAIEHFRAAVKCLEAKIESLKVVVETKPAREPTDFVDPAERAEQEIKDIKEILPEIRNKIEDAQEEMKNMDNLKSLAKEAMGQMFGADSSQQEGFSASSQQSTDDKKPVTNISHLIRKKRKPEEEEADATAESKKVRQEEGRGDAAESPTCEQNGHKENTEATTETTTKTNTEPMTTG